MTGVRHAEHDQIPSARKRSDSDTHSMKILAVLDDSERTGRVVKCLLELGTMHGSIDVILLNVQPKPQDWRMRGYGWFQREAIHDRLINDLGSRIVRSAARHLDGAGIRHKCRIEVGDAGDTILRCAREEECNLIVLAEHRVGHVRSWLMRTAGLSIGSIASFVVQFARVAVLVVP